MKSQWEIRRTLWEYKVTNLTEYPNLEKGMNILGKQGWRLVTNYYSHGGIGQLRYVFIRELER